MEQEVPILLTGASGFVGKATLTALLRKGADVVAVSRSRPEIEGKYTWCEADLFDTAAIARVLRETRPEIVLHLAWTVEHGQFWTAPENLDFVAASLMLAPYPPLPGNVQRFCRYPALGYGVRHGPENAEMQMKGRHAPLAPLACFTGILKGWGPPRIPRGLSVLGEQIASLRCAR